MSMRWVSSVPKAPFDNVKSVGIEISSYYDRFIQLLTIYFLCNFNATANAVANAVANEIFVIQIEYKVI